MADRDEDEIVEDLVKVVARAGASVYDDWEYSVCSYVWAGTNVSTCAAIAYSQGEAEKVRFGRIFKEVQVPLMKYGRELSKAQGSAWVGVKCSVSRDWRFRLDYSYDAEEAVRWIGDAFTGGSSPDVLVEVLRPVGL